jgi:UPF0716 family protein affecting phage T7 exclusion
MEIVVSVIGNLLVCVLLVFAISLGLMMVLNPGTTPKEIFTYWGQHYRKNEAAGGNKQLKAAVIWMVAATLFAVIFRL